ncbi:uncharacterized protein LOC113758700 [Coffea eugenioides]|uniref:uncharacterized protein LOC113758700 n=1 Tax=Coffea eugenioides TaxID=49369 RepID=UPI000F612002|nr:uncharacterized protein LOC113758700 [Coffea eugenioides]
MAVLAFAGTAKNLTLGNLLVALEDGIIHPQQCQCQCPPPLCNSNSKSSSSSDFILLSLFISSSPFPTAPPPSSSFPTLAFSYSSSSTTTSVIHYLGFQLLSTAVPAANLSSTPITIFVPSDSSLLTCPSCSLPLLLRQYSVPGLYTLCFLRNLAFGTKIETLAPNYCLTITTATNASSPHAAAAVFVNGVEITGPDLFNNGVLIIHGLDGFVSHLSTLSCDIDQTTTLSFPQPSSPHLSVIRPMLKDAILRLRVRGYGVLALALRMKFKQLSELKAMTVFALDDVSVFSGGGHATFLSDFWFHVAPQQADNGCGTGDNAAGEFAADYGNWTESDGDDGGGRRVVGPHEDQLRQDQ